MLLILILMLIIIMRLENSDQRDCPSRCDRGWVEGCRYSRQSSASLASSVDVGEEVQTYEPCETCGGMGFITREHLREYLMERMG